MATFSVKPAALHAYADLLGGDGGSLGSALNLQYLTDYSAYVDEWIKLGDGGLLFQKIKDRITVIHDRLSLDSLNISTNLVESSMGLDAAATTYRNTDRDVSEHIDAAYHTGRPEGLPGSDGGASLSAPDKELTEPSEEGGVPELAQQILDGAGVMSVSDLVLKILGWCGLDVMGWVRDRFTGSMAELAQCKNALDNLASFDSTASSDVSIGAAHMLTQWSGNAANAAQDTFAKTSDGLSSHATALSGVSNTMTALIAGIQELTAAIEGGITTAIDAALEAAAAVAAAGCLEEVPGVDVLADIIGGWRVYKVYKAVKEVTDIWNVVWAGNEGVMGLIMTLAGGLDGWDVSSDLPKTPYYNGAQGPAPTYSGSS